MALAVLLSGIIPSLAFSEQNQSQAGQGSSSRITLEAASLDGVALSYTLPAVTAQRSSSAQGVVDVLTVPGADHLRVPGKPALPVLTTLVAVPPEAELDLAVELPATRELAGTYTIAPANRPRPMTGQEDFQPGEWEYFKDINTYAADQWYPEQAAVIADEAWARDQRMVRIEIYPYQYNPARGLLRVHEQFVLNLNFSNNSTLRAMQLTWPATASQSDISSSVINPDQAAAWRSTNQAAAFQRQLQNPLAGYSSMGDRYSIVVSSDGVYRLTYADLMAAGMDVDNIDPQSFHLYNHGLDVAIYVIGEGDSSFDPADSVIFYGEKFHGDILADRYESQMTDPDSDPYNVSTAPNNWFWQCIEGCDLDGHFEKYTDNNTYYLTVGGSSGPRMGSMDGTPGGATVPTEYQTTVKAEESTQWWSYEYYDEEIWFWDRLTGKNVTRTFTTTIDHVASGPLGASIHAELASRSPGVLDFPDHHSVFWLNGNAAQPLDDAEWDGATRHTFDEAIAQSALVDGVNSLSYVLKPDGKLFVPSMYFDFFEITFWREFFAVDDQLAFDRAAAGTWRYEIDNVSSATASDYVILNVSDPFSPDRVTNATVDTGGGNTLEFQVTDSASESYIAAGPNAIAAPDSIAFYSPPDFTNMTEVEYLFIAHEIFLTELEPLATHRQAAGLTTAVIDVADLYHEFNDGNPHPIAIKNFLAFAFANWTTPPEYALLVGSGHWNFKDYGFNNTNYIPVRENYMPPNLAYVDPWQGEVDSLNLLATLVGDDAIPDIHMGRIPAASAAELNQTIDKILEYEAQPELDWHGNITFVSDNIPDAAGAFEVLSDDMISDYVDTEQDLYSTRIYETSGFGCSSSTSPECMAVTRAITNTLNQTGTLILNYIGHASLNLWSGEKVLEIADITSMTNNGQYPVMLSMTCLDGYHVYPGIDSLAVQMLLAEDKGAVAAFSATGLGVATGHDFLHRGFFDSIIETGNPHLGPAALEAKIRLFGAGYSHDLLHTFTIFGDPALRLNLPESVLRSNELYLPITIRP
jgi:hypothetical protein